MPVSRRGGWARLRKVEVGARMGLWERAVVRSPGAGHAPGNWHIHRNSESRAIDISMIERRTRVAARTSVEKPEKKREPDAGIRVVGEIREEWQSVLSSEALGFIEELVRGFDDRRRELLDRRNDVQAEIDDGRLPDFLPETRHIRKSEWKVAPIPPDLEDRRVEITGPVDRKMIINALNSGANVFMADFEDSTSPTWENIVEGQINLIEAIDGTITWDSPEGKHYELEDSLATLVVRPRGWHLYEAHVEVDGKPVSASLFDFGLYFFHNAKRLMEKGTAPYFYLPKLESHREARLWNDVFVFAQKRLRIPLGTIRATVLIETILAAFETEEILHELRDHSAGLNCGRWDYIFSFIKRFSSKSRFVLPDRALVTMTTPFMRSYSKLVIRSCHKRGIHAMGGMAAQIPIKADPEANDEAIAKVVADKKREVEDGHDGTWVAHPGLVEVARKVFDEGMKGPHQIERKLDDLEVTAADLLRVPSGPITERGVRQNINVGLQYLAAWLGGTGSVALYNLMEDAATAEISRAQLWQWVRHGAKLDDGRRIDADLYRQIRDEELASIVEELEGDAQSLENLQAAREIFDELILGDEIAEFLTLPAYERLRAGEGN
jgi:malate synthase